MYLKKLKTLIRVEEKAHPKKEVKTSHVRKVESKEKIFDNFYNEDDSQAQISNIIVKKDKEEILNEVKEGINTLIC